MVHGARARSAALSCFHVEVLPSVVVADAVWTKHSTWHRPSIFAALVVDGNGAMQHGIGISCFAGPHCAAAHAFGRGHAQRESQGDQRTPSMGLWDYGTIGP